MGYINENLMDKEKLLYEAKLHWFIFMPGLILLFVGIVLFIGDPKAESYFFNILFGLLALLLGIYCLIKAAIIKATTELAVTSRRVIAKTGLIRRNTTELNHGKVESFSIVPTLGVGMHNKIDNQPTKNQKQYLQFVSNHI